MDAEIVDTFFKTNLVSGIGVSLSAIAASGAVTLVG
jgi:hypothetical protein